MFSNTSGIVLAVKGKLPVITLYAITPKDHQSKVLLLVVFPDKI